MAEREIERWITVNGEHIPIFKGQSVKDAVNKAIAKHNEKKKEKDIQRNKEEADRLNGKLVKPTKGKKLKIPKLGLGSGSSGGKEPTNTNNHTPSNSNNSSKSSDIIKPQSHNKSNNSDAKNQKESVGHIGDEVVYISPNRLPSDKAEFFKWWNKELEKARKEFWKQRMAGERGDMSRIDYLYGGAVRSKSDLKEVIEEFEQKTGHKLDEHDKKLLRSALVPYN